MLISAVQIQLSARRHQGVLILAEQFSEFLLQAALQTQLSSGRHQGVLILAEGLSKFLLARSCVQPHPFLILILISQLSVRNFSQIESGQICDHGYPLIVVDEDTLMSSLALCCTGRSKSAIDPELPCIRKGEVFSLPGESAGLLLEVRRSRPP